MRDLVLDSDEILIHHDSYGDVLVGSFELIGGAKNLAARYCCNRSAAWIGTL